MCFFATVYHIVRLTPLQLILFISISDDALQLFQLLTISKHCFDASAAFLRDLNCPSVITTQNNAVTSHFIRLMENACQQLG